MSFDGGPFSRLYGASFGLELSIEPKKYLQTNSSSGLKHTVLKTRDPIAEKISRVESAMKEAGLEDVEFDNAIPDVLT